MSTRVVDLLEHTDISENVRNAACVVEVKICSVEQRYTRYTTVKGQFLHTCAIGVGKKLIYRIVDDEVVNKKLYKLSNKFK